MQGFVTNVFLQVYDLEGLFLFSTWRKLRPVVSSCILGAMSILSPLQLNEENSGGSRTFKFKKIESVKLIMSDKLITAL